MRMRMRFNLQAPPVPVPVCLHTSMHVCHTFGMFNVYWKCMLLTNNMRLLSISTAEHHACLRPKGKLRQFLAWSMVERPATPEDGQPPCHAPVDRSRQQRKRQASRQVGRVSTSKTDTTRAHSMQCEM